MRYGDNNAIVTKVSWARLAWNLGFGLQRQTRRTNTLREVIPCVSRSCEAVEAVSAVETTTTRDREFFSRHLFVTSKIIFFCPVFGYLASPLLIFLIQLDVKREN
jgi:hypothetical protein